MQITTRSQGSLCGALGITQLQATHFSYNSGTGISLSDFNNNNNTIGDNSVIENLCYGIYIVNQQR